MTTGNMNFRTNLRYLCSLDKSIAETSRRTGINRQQFNKYLNGTTIPSINTLQRICNHFSVDETELFLPHAEFRKLFQLRSSADQISSDILETWNMVRNKSDEQRAKDLVGKYFVYSKADEYDKQIVRSVAYISQVDGNVFSSRLFVGADQDSQFKSKLSIRLSGLVYSLDNKLHCIETSDESDVSMVVLTPFTYGRTLRLMGRSLGVSKNFERKIETSDVLWERIGYTPINSRDLRECGFLALEDESIDSTVTSFISALDAKDGQIRPSSN